MKKVVIIGTGPAGLTAALYAARANLGPLVVNGMQPGGQLTTTADVENYPGFPEPVNGFDLVNRMREQAGRFGARFVDGEAVSADFGHRPLSVKLSDGTVLESFAIIIASGARADYLGLESEQKLVGRGVSVCATCDGSFFKNLPVAVVGGGDSAIEEALFLSRLASKVTVIHRRDTLRASKVMSDRVKANKKVGIVWDTVVEEIFDVEKNEVTGLRLRNVKTGKVSELPVAGVFIAVGHKPNSDAFRDQVHMDERGFIAATNTRTSVEGVFAAGDVQDPTYKQAVTAAGSGCMAALETERYLESLGQ